MDVSDEIPIGGPHDPDDEILVAGDDIDRTVSRALTRQLLAHWRARRGPRGVPSRRSIDMVELGPWIGDLAIWDFVAERDDYLCRLYGSRLVARLGVEMTRSWLRDYPAGLGPRLRAHFDRARLTGQPLLIVISHPIRPNPPDPAARVGAQKLVLPMIRSGDDADCLLSYLVFTPPAESA